jgi:hypothetical protein
MKKLACLTLFVVLVAILAACTKATATPNPIDMIEPGDTVNGVLVTTGTKDTVYGFDLPCTQKDNVYTCTTRFGDPTNITSAVFGSTLEELQSKWETFTYTITIEGQPVDVPAFGTIASTNRADCICGLTMSPLSVLIR